MADPRELVILLSGLLDDGVVATDLSGRITDCNSEAERLLGLEVGDLLPADAVAQLAKRSAIAETAPSGLPGVRAPADDSAPTALSELAPRVRSVTLPGDGEQPCGYLLVVGEAAVPQEAAEALALLRSLQKAAPMGHMVFDLDGRYLRVNDAMLAMNGGTREQRIGQSVAEVQPALAADVLAAIGRVKATGRPIHRERLQGEVSAHPGEPRSWDTTYYPVTARDGDLVAVGMICEDVTEAVRATRHVDVVGTTTSALLQAVSLDDVCTTVIETVAPQLGTAGAALLRHDTTMVRTIFGRSAISEVGWSNPNADLTALLACTQTDATSTVEVSPDEARVLFGEGPRTPAHHLVVSSLGSQGGVRWSLLLGYPAPLALSPPELALIEAVAEQCAVALGRAQSFELAERAARLTARLQRVTALLVRAMSEEQIAWVVFREARHAFDATGGALMLRDRDHNQDRSVLSFGRGQTEPGEPGERSLIALTLERREPLYVTPSAELTGVDALPRDGTGNALRQSWAMLPLLRDRLAFGAITLRFADRQAFSDQEQDFLASLAGQAAAAIDRVHRYQTEHQIAVVLQRAQLPERIPVVPGLDVAVRYQSGAEGTQIGGDWYDVFELEAGEVALVIGDVAGHDLSAAAAMGHLRAQLRACAHSGIAPGDTLSALDSLVHRRSDHRERFTTVAYAVWTTGADELELAVAGHLPPLVLDASAVRFYEHPVDPPLGAHVDPFTYRTHRLALDPSSTPVLVLYTDGLVERSGESIDEGMGKLRALAAALDHPDPEELADHLVSHLEPEGGWTDDVALLVCRLAVSERGRGDLGPG